MSESYILIIRNLAKIHDQLELYTRDNNYIKDMIYETIEMFLLSIINGSLSNRETSKLAEMIYNLPDINYLSYSNTKCHCKSFMSDIEEENDQVNYE